MTSDTSSPEYPISPEGRASVERPALAAGRRPAPVGVGRPRIRPAAVLAPLLAVAATLAVTGCGLGETAATAAAGGASEVEQARQAKATEDRLKQQVDAAMRADAQQREAAEKAAQ